MEKSDFSYCGLNCTTCKDRFATIRNKMKELDEAFEVVNIQEMAKAIPFMNSKYQGYRKMADFFNHECPGCRDKGGNPFCGIRKCATKKGYDTCVECSSDLCKKYKSILKVHKDGELQKNREAIKQMK